MKQLALDLDWSSSHNHNFKTTDKPPTNKKDDTSAYNTEQPAGGLSYKRAAHLFSQGFLMSVICYLFDYPDRNQ